MPHKIICLLTVFSVFSVLTGRVAFAQTNKYIPGNSCANKSDDKVLTKIKTKSNDNVAFAEKSIVLANITLPSLWWARQQFDPFGGRLINNWLTYPEVKQINLTVNWQLWSLLDYLGRYRFINQFGTVARRYGYELHIFNQQQQCLASYQYNLESNPPKWEIKLEQSDKDSLQIEPINN